MSTRLRWLGHSAMHLETAGLNVLIDPFLTGNPKASAKAGDLPADFIMVSHGHSDHVGDAIEIAERTGATVIANYEIATWFNEKMGVRNVHGMQHGGAYTFPFGRVKMTLAFHGSALPDGSYGGNPCGFLITVDGGKKIYLACDTGLFGDMKLIGEEGIDLAVLPIGDNYTMGPDDAIRAIKLLNPARVMPVHYDTFPLIAQDAGAWGLRVRKETSAVPLIIHPGEYVDV